MLGIAIFVLIFIFIPLAVFIDCLNKYKKISADANADPELVRKQKTKLLIVAAIIGVVTVSIIALAVLFTLAIANM